MIRRKSLHVSRKGSSNCTSPTPSSSTNLTRSKSTSSVSSVDSTDSNCTTTITHSYGNSISYEGKDLTMLETPTSPQNSSTLVEAKREMVDMVKASTYFYVKNHSQSKKCQSVTVGNATIGKVPELLGLKLPDSFEFKAYCPSHFAKVRKMSKNPDIKDDSKFIENFLKASFFVHHLNKNKIFISECGLYVLKLLSKEDGVFLRKKFMDPYCQHLKVNQNSLLNHFYVFLRLMMDGREIRVLVMDNVASLHQHIGQAAITSLRYQLTESYDLKGSTIGREASEKEKSFHFYKDLDLITHNVKLKLNAETKASLMGQLQSDIQFLVKQGVMDYSALISVYKQKTPSFTNMSIRSYVDMASLPSSHIFLATNDEIYTISLLAFTQSWSTKKRAAMAFKGISKNVDEISSVPPQKYGMRLIKFISSLLE